jgi:hypothetical protein
MKKKMRKFKNGGIADEDFTADQLKFLGGADRTDPYILARMRSKFPDAPKTAKLDTKVDTGELRDETGMVSKIKRNTETGELYSTEAPTPKAETKPALKTEAKAETSPIKPTQSKKTNINEMPEELRAPDYKAPSVVKNVSKEVTKRRPTTPGYISIEKDSMKPSSQKRGEKLMEGAGLNFKSGGKVSSASKRADGCAVRGKTRA